MLYTVVLLVVWRVGMCLRGRARDLQRWLQVAAAEKERLQEAALLNLGTLGTCKSSTRADRVEPRAGRRQGRERTPLSVRRPDLPWQR